MASFIETILLTRYSKKTAVVFSGKNRMMPGMRSARENDGTGREKALLEKYSASAQPCLAEKHPLAVYAGDIQLHAACPAYHYSEYIGYPFRWQ
jgi:hypothetical protein